MHRVLVINLHSSALGSPPKIQSSIIITQYTATHTACKDCIIVKKLVRYMSHTKYAAMLHDELLVYNQEHIVCLKFFKQQDYNLLVISIALTLSPKSCGGLRGSCS